MNIERPLVNELVTQISNWLKFFANLDRPYKRGLVILIDVVVCIVATWIAFSLRLGVWYIYSDAILLFDIVAISCWLPLAYISGVYNTIFRIAGSGAMMTLAYAVGAFTIPISGIFLFYGIDGVPRTIGLLQPLVFFMLLSLSRIVVRYVFTDILGVRMSGQAQHRVLIYGAGSAGQQLAASLQHEPRMSLVGFVDDDKQLKGQRINRVGIFHPDDLETIIDRRHITDILLAMPSLGAAERKRVVRSLEQYPVHVQTLPGTLEIIDGNVSVSNLREVEIGDLLGRDPVAPNTLLLRRTIAGKTVMVTGAGGSIGSELCRQILRLRPTKIILAEVSEFNLYTIEAEISAARNDDPDLSQISVVPELINIAQRDAVQRLMQRSKPDTVFHAAAYKHVPLVEANVISGARNNILGTYFAALAAEQAEVKHFILISTDKAVRPTSVMGATKRVCEMILQAMSARGSTTVFSMVRFGNVLGSSGSVVPHFQKQIRSGGPVTLTDRRITRFFMTIPEAAELVIQAGAMATGGEVFVLDMGASVRILDLAKMMIRLSGMTIRDETSPDGDIEIREIGLRPGEKLYEELLIGNDPKQTRHERIMMASESYIPYEELATLLAKLEVAIKSGDKREIVRVLTLSVPEYDTANSIDRIDPQLLN
jgi:FlaA1/EpsC-like NDP-sugar epimerase